MNFFEKLLHALQFRMTEPVSYGWFHLMWVAILVVFTVIMCLKFKDASDKTFRRITMIVWIVILALEIYKQFSFAFSFENGESKWDYAWYSFPFQLCSTPLYLLPLVAFLKEGKVRDSIIAFLMTFSFFGGLATFVIPEDVFIEETMINIQTMVHHGSQIFIGIFYYVTLGKKINLFYILKGFFTFAVMMGIALLLNIVLYHAFIKEAGDTFNMFYIGPYFDCTLPLLEMFYPMMPKVLFIVLYFICFCIIAVIMYYIMVGIDKLARLIKSKLCK
ncbi:MAG: YwaF family protein [Clostridia bacterium]|nr:YwaF family protein [Clostridia bacterium]